MISFLDVEVYTDSSVKAGIPGRNAIEELIWTEPPLVDNFWIRVRHIPAGDKWHPAIDLLLGTDIYGNSHCDAKPWSIRFDL